MNNLEISTKEKILTVALEMFSKKGYNSVSIRDISKAIGIKESSIYYHFTNKKEILDELLIKSEKLIVAMKSAFDRALSLVSEVSIDAFLQSGIAYVENFLLEKNIFSIINMLTLEKQTNEVAANYYFKLLFDTPLNHHEQVFILLKEKGILLNENPSILASEYQSIILFIFFKYFSSHTSITDECKSAARDELVELLKRFYYRYFGKEK